MDFLIYHPKRQKTTIGDLTIYHDNFDGNQDPYIWNEKFLHTFCHITQLKNELGQINFWVSGDTYPNFTRLLCDCIFVIEEKIYWTKQNNIDRSESIVENDQTFEHHYKWVNEGQHQYKNRKRYTLKADALKSFQPQDSDHNLIDILPFLNFKGITTEKLINSITSRRGSKPFQLDDNLGPGLYDFLVEESSLKLFGSQLEHIHPEKKTKTADNKVPCK